MARRTDGTAARSADVHRPVRHRRAVSGLSVRRARWPDGFRCAGCGHGEAYAIRRRLIDECAACGKQHSLLAGHHLRADQDRPGALVPRHLPGDLEQGRHRRHRAAAADGLRQLPDRLELAAQDPQGDGPARTASRWPTGSRPTRPIVGGAKPGKRGPRRRRQDAGRRCGRGRPRQGPRAAGSAGCGSPPCPTPRPRASKASSPPTSPSRPPSPPTAGPAMPACRPRATPTSRSISAAPGATPRCACPAIHLVFGLAKRWLLGTHHGAVSAKHLPAYLDEYVFRFNRRTAKSISHRFARLVEQAVLTPARHLPRHRRHPAPA